MVKQLKSLTFVNDNISNTYQVSSDINPDWTVNDPSDPRYVHGRTHYVSDELIETVLLSAEVTTQTVYGMNMAVLETNSSVNFIEGETYNITLNGTSYECVAFTMEGLIGVGSTSVIGTDDGNEMPFLIAKAEDLTLVMYVQTGGDYTVSIAQKKHKIIEIPEKFIQSYVDSQRQLEKNFESVLTFIRLPIANKNFTTLGEIKMAIEAMKKGCVIMWHDEILADLRYYQSNSSIGLTQPHIVFRKASIYNMPNGTNFTLQYVLLNSTDDDATVKLANNSLSYPEPYTTYADDVLSYADSAILKKTTSYSDVSRYEDEVALETKTSSTTYPSFKVYWDGTIEGRNLILKSNGEDSASKTVPAISTATVGQTIVVKAIDENGIPTEWEAADMPEKVQSYTATIGTTWGEDSETGVKYQVVSVPALTGADDEKAFVDHTDSSINGTSDGYALFVEEENQYLEFITNGRAETVEGGIRFEIFGDANTIEIPIEVRVG